MVLDRILGLLGLILLASIAGAIYWPSTRALAPLPGVSGKSVVESGSLVRFLILIVWGTLAAGLTGLAVIFSPGLYRPMNRLVRGKGKLEAIVRELEAIGLAYRQNPGRVFAMLGVSTFVHSLYVLAFYSASLAIFDKMPTLAQHYLMVPLALFTTAAPIPFGALGLSEGITGQLFELVGQHEGAIAMMAFRILMYGSGIVAAASSISPTSARSGRSKRKAPLMVGMAIEETVLDPTIANSEVAWTIAALVLATASAIAWADEPPIVVKSNDDRIQITSMELEASIRRTGYVSGVEGKSLLDRATGSRDLGFGLDIVDWLMETGSSTRLLRPTPGDLPYLFNDLVHGKRAAARSKWPQICTRAGRLLPSVISGATSWRSSRISSTNWPHRGKVAGSRWGADNRLPCGANVTSSSSDRVTVANDAASRLHKPGSTCPVTSSIRRVDSFSEVYLSYVGTIPAAESLGRLRPGREVPLRPQGRRSPSPVHPRLPHPRPEDRPSRPLARGDDARPRLGLRGLVPPARVRLHERGDRRPEEQVRPDHRSRLRRRLLRLDRRHGEDLRRVPGTRRPGSGLEGLDADPAALNRVLISPRRSAFQRAGRQLPRPGLHEPSRRCGRPGRSPSDQSRRRTGSPGLRSSRRPFSRGRARPSRPGWALSAASELQRGELILNLPPGLFQVAGFFTLVDAQGDHDHLFPILAVPFDELLDIGKLGWRHQWARTRSPRSR